MLLLLLQFEVHCLLCAAAFAVNEQQHLACKQALEQSDWHTKLVCIRRNIVALSVPVLGTCTSMNSQNQYRPQKLGRVYQVSGHTLYGA
jgi:hypothetical protein